MADTRISCLYYPTTTLLVDDSNRFLNHIALSLGSNLPYKLCSNPIQALDTLQKEDSRLQLPPDVVSTDVTSDNYGNFTETQPINLNISKLLPTIYDPLRFSQVSVVVVDYEMPKMNGLEFCEQLKGFNIKKIMLTGEADELIAVDAFNNGLIDKFIVKGHSEVGKVLVSTIQHLQKSIFQQLSEAIIQGLASEPDACLADLAFINFFNQLCADLNVTEYYLIDTSGSFLLLDRKGQRTWFIVKQDETIEEVVQQALETNAPVSVIEALRKREKIAYFSTPRDYVRTEGDRWKTAVYPAKKLEGEANRVYYYSLVKELSSFEFALDKIATLKDYIGKQNKHASI